mgnify:CR=1 FL=1
MFQIIADSRWGEDLKILLSRIEEMKKRLEPYQNQIELRMGTPRQLFWSEPAPSFQWRVDCRIRKEDKNHPTWNTIMAIINRIKPPHYSWQ